MSTAAQKKKKKKKRSSLSVTSQLRNPVVILLIVGVLVAVLTISSILLRAANDSTSSNIERAQEQQISEQSDGLPAGVTPVLVDSLGPFVARSAYNVDLERDHNRNDALLRHARAGLSQTYIEDLNTWTRSEMYVGSNAFEQMRQDGIIRLVPSTAISQSEHAIDAGQHAVRVYRLHVTPEYSDGALGEPIIIDVQLNFTRYGSGWQVNNVTQL